MVVDMQGSDHILFDREIASKELLDGEEVLFLLAVCPLQQSPILLRIILIAISYYCTLLGPTEFPKQSP